MPYYFLTPVVLTEFPPLSFIYDLVAHHSPQWIGATRMSSSVAELRQLKWTVVAENPRFTQLNEAEPGQGMCSRDRIQLKNFGLSFAFRYSTMRKCSR